MDVMDKTVTVEARTEVRDNMRITWHQPIVMDDGLVLDADVLEACVRAGAADMDNSIIIEEIRRRNVKA